MTILYGTKRGHQGRRRDSEKQEGSLDHSPWRGWRVVALGYQRQKTRKARGGGPCGTFGVGVGGVCGDS